MNKEKCKACNGMGHKLIPNGPDDAGDLEKCNECNGKGEV